MLQHAADLASYVSLFSLTATITDSTCAILLQYTYTPRASATSAQDSDGILRCSACGKRDPEY